MKAQFTTVVATVILLAGLLRVILGETASPRLDQTTLLYFFGAGAVFLLSRAKTFKFGDLQLELDRLKDEVSEARLVANIAQDAMATERPRAAEGEAQDAAFADKHPGSAPDDPWKGVFGGRSIDKAAGRVLTAEVVALPSLRGWYSLTLKVGTLPGAVPLEGYVRFHLHHTFPNDRPVVRAVGGEAVLHLKAWGAFTVGTLSDGGTCELELDLAQLSGAPLEFRSR